MSLPVSVSVELEAVSSSLRRSTLRLFARCTFLGPSPYDLTFLVTLLRMTPSSEVLGRSGSLSLFLLIFIGGTSSGTVGLCSTNEKNTVEHVNYRHKLSFYRSTVRKRA